MCHSAYGHTFYNCKSAFAAVHILIWVTITAVHCRHSSIVHLELKTLVTVASGRVAMNRNWSGRNHQFWLALLLLLLFSFIYKCDSYLKYTEHSCTDLTPKSYNDVTHSEQLSPSKIVHSKWRRKKRSSSSSDWSITAETGTPLLLGHGQGHDHENYDTYDEVPFKVRVFTTRYRRDGDVTVYIEGNTRFDGLILQARAIPGTSVAYVGTAVGLVGQFEDLRKPYKYLTCFDRPYGTVIDGGGHEGLLRNVSFLWHSPDYDVGDIKFTASVSRGIHYWTLVSSILKFNPFPISSYSCGSTIACFRVCPKNINPCLPREGLFVFTYHAEHLLNGFVEFTIGGRIPNNNSYIAVAFGFEYDSLLQAEMIACHIHNGQVKLKHLLIESLYLPPLEPEYIDTLHPMEVYDYDLDSGMLWCRFRRPMRTDTIINPKLNLFHFHFWGSTDYFHQHFHLPRREFIYATKFKRNFTAPYNEIIAGVTLLNPSVMIMMVALMAGTIVTRISSGN